MSLFMIFMPCTKYLKKRINRANTKLTIQAPRSITDFTKRHTYN